MMSVPVSQYKATKNPENPQVIGISVIPELLKSLGLY